MSNPISGCDHKTGTPKFSGRLTRILNYIIPMLCALGVAFYIGNICSYEIVTAASINGNFIGYVDKLDVIAKQKRELEGQISETLGEDFKLDCKITYSFTHTKDPVYLTESECASLLWENACKDFVDAYMLYVDDKKVAANEDYNGLFSLISQIETDLLKSGGENFSRVEISNRLRIEKQICPKTYLKTLDDINVILNPLADEQVNEKSINVVSAKNTESEPNEELAMIRVSSFLAAVPGINSNELIDPNVDYGLVRQSDADATDQDITLSYKFIRTETVEEIILYNTIYVDDFDHFIGIDKVVNEGSNGLRSVTYEISCDAQGRDLEKTEISESIIIHPVDKIIMVGAKEIPEAVSTGTFIWPCITEKGISSGYGGRDLKGSYDFHLGIDIPNNKGTEIYASDGGEVIWAGYTPSYGYSVRIQHKDNFITVYAHLSKILVSVGDMVYQGQNIGLMGDSGVAYGSHLHFEVRIGSLTVNPIKYLPKLVN
jgi:murein DD-endopeptidase MepM/ murein hydrolase activator NlpD